MRYRTLCLCLFILCLIQPLLSAPKTKKTGKGDGTRKRRSCERLISRYQDKVTLSNNGTYLAVVGSLSALKSIRFNRLYRGKVPDLDSIINPNLFIEDRLRRDDLIKETRGLFQKMAYEVRGCLKTALFTKTHLNQRGLDYLDALLEASNIYDSDRRVPRFGLEDLKVNTSKRHIRGPEYLERVNEFIVNHPNEIHAVILTCQVINVLSKRAEKAFKVWNESPEKFDWEEAKRRTARMHKMIQLVNLFEDRWGTTVARLFDAIWVLIATEKDGIRNIDKTNILYALGSNPANFRYVDKRPVRMLTSMNEAMRSWIWPR